MLDRCEGNGGQNEGHFRNDVKQETYRGGKVASCHAISSDINAWTTPRKQQAEIETDVNIKGLGLIFFFFLLFFL